MNIYFFRFTNNQSSRFRIRVVGYHSCQRGRWRCLHVSCYQSTWWSSYNCFDEDQKSVFNFTFINIYLQLNLASILISILDFSYLGKASIQLDTQHPEAQRKIAQLEADKGPSRTEEPEKVFDKPIFTQLLTGPTELWEGQTARYECRVVPVGDASLRFEWYINGVELKMGKDFTHNDENELNNLLKYPKRYSYYTNILHFLMIFYRVHLLKTFSILFFFNSI